MNCKLQELFGDRVQKNDVSEPVGWIYENDRGKEISSTKNVKRKTEDVTNSPKKCSKIEEL